MILQALHNLYDRLAVDPEYGLAEPGYSIQNVTFAVVLNPDGSLHGVADEEVDVAIRDPKGKSKSKRRPRQLKLPGQAKPTGQGINPGFLWDNTKYLLGFDAKDEKPDRTRLSFETFREKHLKLEAEIDDPGYSAVCRFLEQWQPEAVADHPELSGKSTGFGVFRILGERGYVHERPRIREWWQSSQKAGTSRGAEPSGMCLISGVEDLPLARKHEPKIKGVALSSGALMVSFNCLAFES
ncbi:MAG: type I-C CRISPR-associated protein Cas8c/Csd1, partial [Magnetococcales bacterium]|nr:type I-C CRISPR-associated protein Cas8c/Csd1 [Magnetococcales bacterium]